MATASPGLGAEMRSRRRQSCTGSELIPLQSSLSAELIWRMNSQRRDQAVDVRWRGLLL